MTATVCPEDLAVGDHVTVFYHYKQAGVTKPYIVEHEGVVTELTPDCAYLRDEEGNGRWVNSKTSTNNRTYTVTIDRHRRAWVEGGDYLVTAPTDQRGTVRIWKRQREGWMTTSGYRLGASLGDFTIGSRVLITVADR